MKLAIVSFLLTGSLAFADNASQETKIAVDLFNVGQDYISTEKCDLGLSRLQMAVDLKNKDAATFVGDVYAQGKCGKANPKKSISYYKIASDLGDASGQNLLAIAYATGIGVKKDDKKAVELFRKSAEQGWSEAQFNLALCYKLGLGVDLDLDQAKTFLVQSTKRGNAEKINEYFEKSQDSKKKVKSINFVHHWADLNL